MNIRRIFNISVFLFVLSFPSFGIAESVTSLQGLVDWSCIQFQYIGPCVKPTPPYVGVKVRYWQPVLLIETVKKPGDVTIDEFKSIVGPMLQSATSSLMSSATGVGVMPTSSQTCNSDDTNTQMNETHVYGFPFEQAFNAMVATQCPDQTEMNQGVVYLSELDSIEWRMGFMEAMNPKSMASAALGPICAGVGAFANDLCMGSWGPTYPRRGFMTHHSEVVGSAAASYRAVNIAGLQLSTPHIVTHPLAWQANPQTDKIQPLSPHQGSCIKIGALPLEWESGKTSVNGKYLWVYWKKKECCIF